MARRLALSLALPSLRQPAALRLFSLPPPPCHALASLADGQPLARLLRTLLANNNYAGFRKALDRHHPGPWSLQCPQTLAALADIFDGLATVGRGTGFMRRIMAALHVLGYPPGSQHLVETYVGVLIRWGRLDRALAYLQAFNFAPNHPSSAPLNRHISRTLARTNIPRSIFPPSPNAWAKLMSVYLLLGHPDRVLGLEHRCRPDWDECTAHLTRARAITGRVGSRPRPSEETLGPATTELLVKQAHQAQGPDHLLQKLAAQTFHSHSLARPTVNALLDALLDPAQTSFPDLTPARLGECLVRTARTELGSSVGEPEVEKYLRYLRQWLERTVDAKIRHSFEAQVQGVQSEAPKTLLTVNEQDLQIGYQNLGHLLEFVYGHECKLKPSSVVSAELSRIEALVGRSSTLIRAIISESVLRPELGTSTSHMIALVWSKLVEADLVGLLELLERELVSGYRLVLTGLLISLVLGGLVALRAPKWVLLQFSQRLGDKQQQSSPREHHPDGGPANYVRAARAAAAAGDFFLVRELHQEMVNRYGHTGYADAAGRNEEGGMCDYLAMVVESLMKLNEPVQAHKEVLALLADAKVLEAWVKEEKQEEVEQQGHVNCFYLANEEMRRYLMRKEPTLLLVDHRTRRPFKRRLINTLRDSKRRLQIKMDRLEALSEIYEQAVGILVVTDQVDDGGRGKMFGKKTIEVEERLKELRVANELNEEVMRIWDNNNTNNKDNNDNNKDNNNNNNNTTNDNDYRLLKIT